MNRRRHTARLGGGEVLLGSAAARAVESERRRLDLPEEAQGWPEIWGRRIGRALGWIAFLALALWLAATLAGAGDAEASALARRTLGALYP